MVPEEGGSSGQGSSVARARAHPVQHRYSSLSGWSNEIEQSHLLKDVALCDSLLVIPFGRLEQSPPNLFFAVL